MQLLNNNTQAFLVLARAGLWEQDISLSQLGTLEFNEIYRLAEEQSIVGLIAAGLEHVKDVKVPQDVALTFVGQALQLEQRNVAMNLIVNELISRIEDSGFKVYLIKGQGIAQSYERPLWRSSGDVDLLVHPGDYNSVRALLSSIASDKEREDRYSLHQAFTINNWPIELHGTMRGGLWKKIDRALDNMQSDLFLNEIKRIWNNNGYRITLLDVNSDVIFVFCHILQHFYKEGIGLRQICDWCRVLWIYHEEIDKKLLEDRLKEMGAMSEWRAFASFAVSFLGMLPQNIPFYSDNQRWNHKAKKICNLIMRNGNFGHNRDMSFYNKYPFIVSKIISFCRHTMENCHHFTIFPINSIRVWNRMLINGVKALFY